jgi:hypothetical protein
MPTPGSISPGPIPDSAALTYRAWDGTTDAVTAVPWSNGAQPSSPWISRRRNQHPFSTATDSLALVVLGNARPVLSTTVAPALQAVSTQAAAPVAGEQAGTLVSDLLAPAGLYGDADAADPHGIAITALASGLELYTSTNNGASWSKASAPAPPAPCCWGPQRCCCCATPAAPTPPAASAVPWASWPGMAAAASAAAKVP